MKSKIQIIIGLITAIVSIAGVLLLFTRCLIDPPCAPYTISPLGLILPAVYGIFLIRKKLGQVRLIFWVWFISWIITLFFIFHENIRYYYWLQPNFFDRLVTIHLYLWVTVGLPTFDFLYFLCPFNNISAYSFAWRAITGVIVMIFLWIGVKGLEQTKRAKDPAVNSGANQK